MWTCMCMCMCMHMCIIGREHRLVWHWRGWILVVCTQRPNQGAWDCMWVLVRPLRACKSLCERSSGMSFICAVKRAGCIVLVRWAKAGLIGQPCCGESRVPTLVVESLGSRLGCTCMG